MHKTTGQEPPDPKEAQIHSTDVFLCHAENHSEIQTRVAQIDKEQSLYPDIFQPVGRVHVGQPPGLIDGRVRDLL